MEAGTIVDADETATANSTEPEPGSLADFWIRFRKRPWARRSLLVFPRDTALRRLAISITHWRHFDMLMTCIVVANSIFMLLYQPRLPSDVGLNLLTEQADFFFNLIFLFELCMQVIAVGLVVPDPNEGRYTDIYTLTDLMRSHFGFRTIPPVTIGNVALKAPSMSRARLRAILSPFFMDDGEGNCATALIEALEAALCAPPACHAADSIAELSRTLADKGWRFLPRRRRPDACPARRFLTALACLELLQQLVAETLERIEAQPIATGGAQAVLRERLAERVEHMDMRRPLDRESLIDCVSDFCDSYLIEHVAQIHSERAEAVFDANRERGLQRKDSAAGSFDTPTDEKVVERISEFLLGEIGGPGGGARGGASSTSGRRGAPSTSEQLRTRLTEVSLELVGLLKHTLSVSVLKLQADGVLAPRVSLKKAYLLSNENRLDFLVVATSWLTFVLERLPGSGSGGANIKALRLLRLLKPLRALKAFPGLQLLITVCGALMHQLLTVFALTMLLLVWWLAMLAPLWHAALTHRCVPVDGVGTSGMMNLDSDHPTLAMAMVGDSGLERLCRTDEYGGSLDAFNGGGRTCPAGFACVDTGVGPAGGYRRFDSVPWGLLTLLQIATLDRWSTVLYELQDGLADWVVLPVFLVMFTTAFGALLLSLNCIVIKCSEVLQGHDQLARSSGRNAEQDAHGEQRLGALPEVWTARTRRETTVEKRIARLVKAWHALRTRLRWEGRLYPLAGPGPRASFCRKWLFALVSYPRRPMSAAEVAVALAEARTGEQQAPQLPERLERERTRNSVFDSVFLVLICMSALLLLIQVCGLPFSPRSSSLPTPSYTLSLLLLPTTTEPRHLHLRASQQGAHHRLCRRSRVQAGRLWTAALLLGRVQPLRPLRGPRKCARPDRRRRRKLWLFAHAAPIPPPPLLPRPDEGTERARALSGRALWVARHDELRRPLLTLPIHIHARRHAAHQ